MFFSLLTNFHSTETVLLKVHNDIAPNLDAGKVTALTLLDLSATFEIVDYSVLLDCLSDWYAISGIAGSAHSYK